MVKKIGEDRFPKERKGARPRTIPKTEEEIQERLRLMEESHKAAARYMKEKTK